MLDLFGGSGSTLIAAEQLNRIGYLMELDPAYASVIVRRYASHKGSIDDIKVIRNGEVIEGKEICRFDSDELLHGDSSIFNE